MIDNNKKLALVLFVLSTTLVLGSTIDAYAQPPPIPFSVEEISDYVAIGLGDGSDGTAISWSNFEIGANKNFFPPQGGACLGPTIEGNAAIVPNMGVLPVTQGQFNDAGTAITDPTGKISLSNIGVYSAFGIRMADDVDVDRVA